MYIVTVLPNSTKTVAGKAPIQSEREDVPGSALVRFVFPVDLVTEFDTWLDTSLQTHHVERPHNTITEYTDPAGHWAGIDGLQVIYYVVVGQDQLEKIEQFASEFKDLTR